MRTKLTLTKDELFNQYNEIGPYTLSKKLSVSPKTVFNWLSSFDIKPNRLENIVNLSPSINLAYILGAVLGDGSVFRTAKGTYLVQLGNIRSEEFALSFAAALSAIGLSPWIYPHKNEYANTVYTVRACSKRFLEWYEKLTLKDFEHLLNSDELCLAFIRGFYESEGSCSVTRYHYNMRIYNSNRDLLALVQRLLWKMGFRSVIYGPYFNKKSKKGLFHLIVRGGNKPIFASLI